MARNRRRNKKSSYTPVVAEEPVSGVALAAILPKAPKHKSRLLFIFLALVLPGFGLNNFYAGYRKRAIIQFLCMLSIVLMILSFLMSLSPFFMLFPIVLVNASFVMTIWDVVVVRKDAKGVPFT